MGFHYGEIWRAFLTFLIAQRTQVIAVLDQAAVRCETGATGET